MIKKIILGALILLTINTFAQSDNAKADDKKKANRVKPIKEILN